MSSRDYTVKITDSKISTKENDKEIKDESVMLNEMLSNEDKGNCDQIFDKHEMSAKTSEVFAGDVNPNTEIRKFPNTEATENENKACLEILKKEVLKAREDFPQDEDKEKTDNENMLKSKELNVSKNNHPLDVSEMGKSVIKPDEILEDFSKYNESLTNIAKNNPLKSKNTELEYLNFAADYTTTEENSLDKEEKGNSFRLDKNSLEPKIRTGLPKVNGIKENVDKINVTEGKEVEAAFDVTMLSSKIREDSNVIEREEGELVDEESISEGEDKLETEMYGELKNDIKILKAKSRKVNRRLKKYEGKILFQDLLHKDILELKKELSRYLNSVRNLKPEFNTHSSCPERQSTDVTLTNNKSSLACAPNPAETKNKYPKSKLKHKEKRFVSFEKKDTERGSCERRNGFRRNCWEYAHDNERKRNSSATKQSYEDYSHTCSISKYHRNYDVKCSDKCLSASEENRKTTSRRNYNNEASSKVCIEKRRIRSLINRQVDLINKHVSKVDCPKQSIPSNDVVKNAQHFKQERNNYGTPEDMISGKVKTIKDMELFLSLLQERKRKALDQGEKMCKKTKTMNRVDSNIIDRKFIENCKSTTYKILKGVKDIEKTEEKVASRETISQRQQNFMEVNKAMRINTDSGILRGNCETIPKIKDEPCYEKFAGKIHSLQDMEAFLSFLRNKRKSSDNDHYKLLVKRILVNSESQARRKEDALNTNEEFTETNSTKNKNEKSENHVNCFNLRQSRIYQNEKFSTSQTQEYNKLPFLPKRNTLHRWENKTPNKFSPDLDGIEMKFKKNSNKKCTEKPTFDIENNILSAYNSTLYTKINENNFRRKHASKSMVSHTTVTKNTSNGTDRDLNGINEGNKEISLKKIRAVLQKHKAEELERTNSEEMRPRDLNSEKKDRFLEGRDTRKAKLMACVMVKPEKISQLLKDLKKTKLGEDGHSLFNEKYKKVLQKITVETKTINMA